MPTVFEQCFSHVIGDEGGYTSNPRDPGNWTSGRVDVGACKGTKFGISASAYPNEDIANLTLDAARTIYRRDYWNAIAGDHLPPALALLVFDAAVNNGTSRAARWLQTAVGAETDGRIGPATLKAIDSTVAKPGAGVALCAEFMTERTVFMAGLPTWPTFGKGWARRLCRLPFDAMQITP